MKMRLKKARLLVTDVQQSCSQHQRAAADANKQARLALNDVCTRLYISHYSTDYAGYSERVQ